MNRPDLLAEIDQRNRDYMLTERIRGLVRDYLAPTPGATADGAGIPVSVPPPPLWRPERGRAPAATTQGPTAARHAAGPGRETRGHPFVSRPYSQGRPTGDGRSAPGRGGRMGRPSRPLP